MPDEPQIPPDSPPQSRHRRAERPSDEAKRRLQRTEEPGRPTKEEVRSRLRGILTSAPRQDTGPDPEPPAESPSSPPPAETKPSDEWLEWDKPDPVSPGDPDTGQDAKTKRRTNRGISPSTAGWAVLIFVVLLVLASLVSYSAGTWAERQRELAAATKEGLRTTPDFEARLDAAMADLRNGRSREALEALQSLEVANPTVASLSYLIGLAAMQEGDFVLAGRKLNESIAKRERVSDSLAVLAAVEGQKVYDPSFKVMGDARMRAEIYLRRSMMADAANPFPMIEMASLLRTRKKPDEALRLLKSARPRLNPVDSHTVVDTVIALLTLENMPDDKLPRDLDPTKDPASAFAAAYVAMRLGDFPLAAGILKDCRRRLPADLYSYLIFDPSLEKFSNRPELAGAFQ